MDSNILMLSSELRLDPFSSVEELLARGVEFGIIPQVVKELERISQKPTKEGKMARFALEMASRCHVWDQADTSGAVDDAIVRAANELRTAVCTADAKLRKRLRKDGIPVIVLRGRRRFFLDGVLTD